MARGGSQGAAGVAPVTDYAGAPVWSPPCFPDLNIVEEKYLRLLRIERKWCARGCDFFSLISSSLLFSENWFWNVMIGFRTHSDKQLCSSTKQLPQWNHKQVSKRSGKGRWAAEKRCGARGRASGRWACPVHHIPGPDLPWWSQTNSCILSAIVPLVTPLSARHGASAATPGKYMHATGKNKAFYNMCSLSNILFPQNRWLTYNKKNIFTWLSKVLGLKIFPLLHSLPLSVKTALTINYLFLLITISKPSREKQ